MDPRQGQSIFDRNVSELEHWRAGERLDHRKLNRPLEAIQKLAARHPGPRQLLPAGRRRQTLVAEQFRVKIVGDDYLVCHPLLGVAEGEDNIKVAKPYQLRRTPFDGQTYNGVTYSYAGSQSRTASAGTETEDQIIIPAYVVEDVIYCARNVVGGTGVKVGVPPDDIEAEWVDLNVDGRAWAKQWEPAP